MDYLQFRELFWGRWKQGPELLKVFKTNCFQTIDKAFRINNTGDVVQIGSL